MRSSSLIALLLTAACSETPAPSADAGTNIYGQPGQRFTFDGRASTGESLTFRWTLGVTPDQSSLTDADIEGGDTPSPSLETDAQGSFELILEVCDPLARCSTDSAFAHSADRMAIQGQAPVANAGADQTISMGETALLDGTASFDPEGANMLYSWIFMSVPSDSNLVRQDISGRRSDTASFSPDAEGTYDLRLYVTDGALGDTDRMLVTVGPSASGNLPPVPDAGPDQSVTLGDVVALDGGGSSDPDGDGLTYQWGFHNRPANSGLIYSDVQDRFNSAASFVPDVPGTYTMKLYVNDGSVEARDYVVIDVASTSNTAPVAEAGTDIEVSLGDTVYLDGSGSSDADGDTLSYRWGFYTRPQGHALTWQDFSNRLTDSASFVPDVEGLWRIKLIVDDGQTQDIDYVNVTVGQGAPNLEVSSATASIHSAAPGDSVDVSFTIENSGVSDADSFVVAAYLSSDGTVDSSDTRICETTISAGLSAGAYMNGLLNSCALDSSLSDGSYTIGVIVDADEEVTESEEGDNVGTDSSALTVSAPTYDLDPNQVNAGDYAVQPGDSVQYSFDTSNYGNATVSAVPFELYYSLNTSVDSSDYLICSGSLSGSLAAGGTTSHTETCSVPTYIPADSYYLIVRADPNNSVSETDENNNDDYDGTRVTISNPLPDLEPASVSLSDYSGEIGDSFTTSLTVYNLGDAATGSYDVSIRFSNNTTISTQDQEICTTIGSSIGSGGSRNLSISGCTVPSVSDGTYYVGVILDDAQRISESDEGNNDARASSAFTVTSTTYDLEPTWVSAEDYSVQPGDSVNFRFEITNSGNTEVWQPTFDLYYSTNRSLDSSDEFICSGNLSGYLLAGTTELHTETCSVPSNISPDTYYLFVDVDPNNSVSETNESNNDDYDITGVTVASAAQADLEAVSIVTEFTVGRQDTYFSFDYEIENVGTAASGTYEADVVFSTNTYITTSDDVACTLTFSSLAAGASRSGTTSCPIPSPSVLSDRTYYVGLLVDPNQYLSESSISNNTTYDSSGFEVSEAMVDGFQFPVNYGVATEVRWDSDGYYNAQDWTVNTHCGEDWNGDGGGDSDLGDTVYAVARGEVISAAHEGTGWGNIILLEHDVTGAGDTNYEVLQSMYAHLDSMYVSQGDWVEMGDPIGTIGTADGYYWAHLHLEMRWDHTMSATSSGGYNCTDVPSSGTFDPSDFIDTHPTWPM